MKKNIRKRHETLFGKPKRETANGKLRPRFKITG
jgi:hypothetical protein